MTLPVNHTVTKNTRALHSPWTQHTAFSSFRRMITGCARNSTSSRGTRLRSAQWTPRAALLQRSPTLPGSTSKWVMCQTFTRRLSSADIPHFLTRPKAAATVVYCVYLRHTKSYYLCSLPSFHINKQTRQTDTGRVFYWSLFGGSAKEIDISRGDIKLPD